MSAIANGLRKWLAENEIWGRQDYELVRVFSYGRLCLRSLDLLGFNSNSSHYLRDLP